MRIVEDWNVDYVTGENNYGFIMLNECLPWQMTSKMKELTQKNFEDTINKYVDELKALENSLERKDIQIDFEYDSVEYYD